MSNGAFDDFRSAATVTDGIVSSAVRTVGYWMCLIRRPGWSRSIWRAWTPNTAQPVLPNWGWRMRFLDGDWQRGLPGCASDRPTLRRLALADMRRVNEHDGTVGPGRCLVGVGATKPKAGSRNVYWPRYGDIGKRSPNCESFAS